MLEGKGIPTAAIGPDKLILTIGRTMANRHGYSDFPFVVIDYPYAENLTPERLDAHTETAWRQIQEVLLTPGEKPGV
jgi:hypothetical protein